MKNLVVAIVAGTLSLSAGAALADSEFDNLEAFFSADNTEVSSTSDFNSVAFDASITEKEIEALFADQGNRE